MPAYNLEDYEPVEDRIRAFWAEHADGQITTELVHHDEKRFIVKATASRERDSEPFGKHPSPIATGYAEEIVGTSPVNRGNALENCETSAIGRALANAGYAAKGRRPSREEMQKAQRQPERVTPAAEARDALRTVCHNLNMDLHKVANLYLAKYGEALADSESANQIRDFTEYIRKREEREADQ